MRKPYLLVMALALLAILSGWRLMQALDAALPAGDNAARPVATGWQPGAPTPDPPPPPDTAVAVAAVKNRPLFRADRRPYTDAASAISARNFDAELARFSLIGVLSFGDDMRGVVVSKGAPRSERWEVKAGDDLPGFKVKEVRTDGLAVTAEGREFLLPLYAGAPTTGGGAVRTEVTRKEPAPGQPGAAAVAAQPNPASPPVQRPATPQPVPTPPAVQPAPSTPPAPGRAPRYIPGRR